jgi:hypothetical protein
LEERKELWEKRVKEYNEIVELKDWERKRKLRKGEISLKNKNKNISRNDLEENK